MKYFKIINTGIVILLLTLTGCNDDILSNNSAKLSYINALDKQVSFYAKMSSDSKSVYNSKHRVTTLVKGEHSDEIKHKWFSTQDSVIAVEDANSRDEQVSIRYRLEDDRNYWSIAWLYNEKYKLSLLRKAPSNRDGLYRVRIFANDELNVYVGDNTAKLLTTKAGQVSGHFSLDKCTDLIIEDNAIDLCSGDFGHSYLLVVNSKGLIVMAEEH